MAELEKAAAERDVLFVKGTDFLLEGGQNTLRLAYSGVTPEQIDEGITKLAEAVRSLGVSGITTATTPRSTACCTARGRSRCSSTAASGRPSTASTLMDALCADLVARGWAAWNIEYRRLGNGGGVPDTLDDVGAAIDHLAELPGVDRSRVVTIGHSRRRAPRGVGGDARESARGGHRRRLPGGRARPRSARAELRLSNGVVDRFLNGQPTRRRLADRAAPARRPRPAHPRRARRHRAGRDQRALRAGVAARRLIVEPDEDHFGHLDPANPLWKAVIAWL